MLDALTRLAVWTFHHSLRSRLLLLEGFNHGLSICRSSAAIAFIAVCIRIENLLRLERADEQTSHLHFACTYVDWGNSNKKRLYQVVVLR